MELTEWVVALPKALPITHDDTMVALCYLANTTVIPNLVAFRSNLPMLFNESQCSSSCI